MNNNDKQKTVSLDPQSDRMERLQSCALPALCSVTDFEDQSEKCAFNGFALCLCRVQSSMLSSTGNSLRSITTIRRSTATRTCQRRWISDESLLYFTRCLHAVRSLFPIRPRGDECNQPAANVWVFCFVCLFVCILMNASHNKGHKVYYKKAKELLLIFQVLVKNQGDGPQKNYFTSVNGGF